MGQTTIYPLVLADLRQHQRWVALVSWHGYQLLKEEPLALVRVG